MSKYESQSIKRSLAAGATASALLALSGCGANESIHPDVPPVVTAGPTPELPVKLCQVYGRELATLVLTQAQTAAVRRGEAPTDIGALHTGSKATLLRFLFDQHAPEIPDHALFSSGAAIRNDLKMHHINPMLDPISKARDTEVMKHEPLMPGEAHHDVPNGGLALQVGLLVTECNAQTMSPAQIG